MEALVWVITHHAWYLLIYLFFSLFLTHCGLYPHGCSSDKTWQHTRLVCFPLGFTNLSQLIDSLSVLYSLYMWFVVKNDFDNDEWKICRLCYQFLIKIHLPLFNVLVLFNVPPSPSSARFLIHLINGSFCDVGWPCFSPVALVGRLNDTQRMTRNYLTIKREPWTIDPWKCDATKGRRTFANLPGMIDESLQLHLALIHNKHFSENQPGGAAHSEAFRRRDTCST